MLLSHGPFIWRGLQRFKPDGVLVMKIKVCGAQKECRDEKKEKKEPLEGVFFKKLQA